MMSVSRTCTSAMPGASRRLACTLYIPFSTSGSPLANAVVTRVAGMKVTLPSDTPSVPACADTATVNSVNVANRISLLQSHTPVGWGTLRVGYGERDGQQRLLTNGRCASDGDRLVYLRCVAADADC